VTRAEHDRHPTDGPGGTIIGEKEQGDCRGYDQRIEEREEIPRDDVAATLYFTLGAMNTYGLAFDVVSGDDPVDDAVAAIVP